MRLAQTIEEPYSPRMRKMIGDAQRTDRDLLWRRLEGWWFIEKESPHPVLRGLHFRVEGNRLRLLPADT